MLNAPESSLLSPEGADLIDPEDVARALAALWKPPAEADAPAAATRVCAANLLLIGAEDDWPHLANVLGELSSKYPTRTIAVLLTAEGAEARDTVRAAVTAICHVPQPGRPQVCSEQIILRTHPRRVADLDRTVLPLLEADLPLMLWWTAPPAAQAELFYRLQMPADRLIVDAGSAGLDFLEPVGRCATRELGWYRTLRTRELLAQLFDECAPATLGDIDRVEIELAGRSAEECVEALWLAAFLGGQLLWRPGRIVNSAEYELVSNNSTIRLAITFGRSGGRGLDKMTIHGGDNSFSLCRCAPQAEQYRLIGCDERLCRISRCIQLPRFSTAEALAAALAGRPRDAAFARAAPLAAWLAKGLTKRSNQP